MAEPESIVDMPTDEAEDARQDAIALAEIEAGKAVPHERVVDWLLKIKSGEKVPPPLPSGPIQTGTSARLENRPKKSS